MQENDAVINPIKPKSAPPIGPVAVLAATPADLSFLCDLFEFAGDDFYRLITSRLYYDRRHPAGISVTGPFVGAPYAVMLLETLIARGARKIIFLGWCGAVSEKIRIGDIILPISAIIDEGTSGHYGAPNNRSSRASSCLASMIRKVLVDGQVDFEAGEIWTTDAVYRETRQQVEAYRQKGVLAVEMELSALFSVAGFRNVELAGILVVSDELSALKWRPGFKNERFVQARQTACRMVKELCRTLILK